MRVSREWLQLNANQRGKKSSKFNSASNLFTKNNENNIFKTKQVIQEKI